MNQKTQTNGKKLKWFEKRYVFKNFGKNKNSRKKLERQPTGLSYKKITTQLSLF